MSSAEAVHGLACPNCGGMVPIPEGQVIVVCPYCELRSLVRGERGLMRYQVPVRVTRENAQAGLAKFLGSSRAIAWEASRKAALTEVFLVYLPFWATWARVIGWVFGEKKVGSGDDARYEPREIKIAEEMSWNGVACDVGEFGVEVLTLDRQPLEAFDADGLHASGMVFEPVSSLTDARSAGEDEFTARVEEKAKLDRIGQVIVRFMRRHMGLVYYPMWVVRYLYRGRSFQVVLDGYSGQILYGKAPGSTVFRAAVLVAGTALGAVIAVDGAALAFRLAVEADGDGTWALLIGGFGLMAVGYGVMRKAYRMFRYGEQYEYRQFRRSSRKKEAGLVQSVFKTLEGMR
jgi:hypothetical protein